MIEKTDNISKLNNLYNKVEEAVKDKRSLWLNFGFWENTNNIETACRRLVDETIKTINFSNSSKVLDVGFGSGIQDVYLAEKFPDISITGINILRSQTEEAQKLIEEKQLRDSVTLLQEDAVNTPFDNEQFDFIIAIESAFHFNTRERFFREAFRILKPNGKIALADCLPTEGFIINEDFVNAANFMAIPIENMYNIEHYETLLLKSGFKNITTRDISERVLPYAAAEMFNNNGWRTSETIDMNLNKDEISNLIKQLTSVTTIGKYYIVAAEK